MAAYVWVMLGGSLGALARYLIAGAVQSASGSLFPWGTLAVNALGSFLLGYFYEAALRAAIPTEVRVFFAVGVLGSFTTFSTFGYETLGLVREGAWGTALLYAFGSFAAGISSVWLGVWLAGR